MADADDQSEADLPLVRAALRGERGASASIAERLSCVPGMLRLRERHLSLTLSDDERRDAVQETLTAIWAKLDRYRGTSPLEAWAYGFVRREHYKAIGRRDRMPELSTGLDREAHREPERVGSDEQATIRASIHALGPPSSNIVCMRHFDEMDFREIAGELHMPTNTVKTKYYRALRKLRGALGTLRPEGRP